MVLFYNGMRCFGGRTLNLRTITQDVDRILQKLFRNTPPARFLREILRFFEIKVSFSKSPGYNVENETIFVPFSYNLEDVCREWISLRIHRATGRAPQEPQFVREWVRSFFLPGRLLEKHPSYWRLRDLSIQGEVAGWESCVSSLAAHFECSEELVEEALLARGVVRGQRHLSVVP